MTWPMGRQPFAPARRSTGTPRDPRTRKVMGTVGLPARRRDRAAAATRRRGGTSSGPRRARVRIVHAEVTVVFAIHRQRPLGRRSGAGITRSIRFTAGAQTRTCAPPSFCSSAPTVNRRAIIRLCHATAQLSFQLALPQLIGARAAFSSGQSRDLRGEHRRFDRFRQIAFTSDSMRLMSASVRLIESGRAPECGRRGPPRVTAPCRPAGTRRDRGTRHR